MKHSFVGDSFEMKKTFLFKMASVVDLKLAFTECFSIIW